MVHHISILKLRELFVTNLCIIVVQNSMCVEWFGGTHLGTAIGMTTTVSRLVRINLLSVVFLSYRCCNQGSIAAFIFTPMIVRVAGYKLSLWIAFLATVISLVAVLIYVGLDKWAKKDCVTTTARPASFMSLFKFSHLYWIALVIGGLIYATVTTFRGQISCVFVHHNFQNVFPDCDETSSAVEVKYQVSESQANFILSIIDITSLITSPICGWIVDKTFQRGWIGALLANLYVETLLIEFH